MQPGRTRRWIIEASFVLLAAVGTFVAVAVYHANRPQPVVEVRATYQGAPRHEVVSIVAEPIEAQVAGVQYLVTAELSVQDGKYLLVLTFERGADPGLVVQLVRNRVMLATPILPAPVQKSLAICVYRAGDPPPAACELCFPNRP